MNASDSEVLRQIRNFAFATFIVACCTYFNTCGDRAVHVTVDDKPKPITEQVHRTGADVHPGGRSCSREAPEKSRVEFVTASIPTPENEK